MAAPFLFPMTAPVASYWHQSLVGPVPPCICICIGAHAEAVEATQGWASQTITSKRPFPMVLAMPEDGDYTTDQYQKLLLLPDSLFMAN